LVNQTGGFGDAIELIRYLPLLHQKGARVLTRFPDPLTELFKNYDFKAELIDPAIPDTELNYDARICSLCLPAYFKTTPDNVPSRGAYLKADAVKVQAYKEKYFNNDLYKVGIAWNAGSKLNRKVDDRNMDLSYFLKLAELKNIKLYSLQKGLETEN